MTRRETSSPEKSDKPLRMVSAQKTLSKKSLPNTETFASRELRLPRPSQPTLPSDHQEPRKISRSNHGYPSPPVHKLVNQILSLTAEVTLKSLKSFKLAGDHCSLIEPSPTEMMPSS